MPARSLNERVDPWAPKKLVERRRLEQKVEELQTLLDRVTGPESQILQLRGEVRDGISAILARVQEGGEESRRLARLLHEDVISRFALLQEGRGRRKR